MREGAVGALAVGVLAFGVLALGPLAIGALAVGRLVIRYLSVGTSRIRRPEIEERSARASAAAAGKSMADATMPFAFSAFPEEVVGAPRSWVERAYPELTYYNKVDKGCHFAAWEEPELFEKELRPAFGPLR